MNADIKKRWIKALRSGEYSQTKEALKDIGGFCCLGVLCDLHRREHGFAWAENNGYFDELGELPDIVTVWAGLEESDPSLQVSGVLSSCSGANDHYELSFAKIADLIEEQY